MTRTRALFFLVASLLVAAPSIAVGQVAGQALETIAPFCLLRLWVGPQVSAVAFSPDGSALAAGGGRSVLLLDPLTGAVLKTLPADSAGTVTALAFSPDGTLLATGSSDGRIKLWDPRNAKTVRTLQEQGTIVWSLAFSPDGKVLAAGTQDFALAIWDLARGTWSWGYVGRQGRVVDVAFSPDGSALATVSGDGILRIWDYPLGSLRHAIEVSSRGVLAIAFSPDNKVLAAGGWNADATLWDVASGEAVGTLKGEDESSIPPSERLLHWISCLAFSPDGKLLAAGRDFGHVIVWELASGRILQDLQGHKESPAGIAFSPDGKLLASGSHDRTACLWDIAAIEEGRSPAPGKGLPIAEAEQLTLEAMGALVAPEEVVARVASELQTLRLERHEVAGIEARPSWDLHELVLAFDAAAAQAIAEGTYAAWDDLNTHYGVTEVRADLLESSGMVVLRFASAYNAPLLAQEYRPLPGLRYAEPNVIYGDGSDICLCIQGDDHVFVFDSASGDCPSGCTDHFYLGYLADASGHRWAISGWKTGYTDVKPDWLKRLAPCTDRWL